MNAFRERRALALTLNDTKTAVNRLHKMVNIVVGIIILIIWLIILGITSTKFLVVMSSQIVVVAFIFGNMCKIVFESIIYLFVIHPFDVGDRCEIDGVQVNSKKQTFLPKSVNFSIVMTINLFFVSSDGCGRDEHIDNSFLEVR